jgi:hypothetical protein
MSITQLLIKKTAEGCFDIVLYKSEMEIHSMSKERSEAVRFIDDAVDAFLGTVRHMNSMPESGNKRSCLIFEVGDAKDES